MNILVKINYLYIYNSNKTFNSDVTLNKNNKYKNFFYKIFIFIIFVQ